jgi:hypothetical protein
MILTVRPWTIEHDSDVTAACPWILSEPAGD